MGNSASSLPYSIGKQQQHQGSSRDGWTLHEGQRKSDGQQVSVFVAKKPALHKAAVANGSPFTQLAPALHHFSYCKKMRHPHILSVHATLDTDNPSESDFLYLPRAHVIVMCAYMSWYSSGQDRFHLNSCE